MSADGTTRSRISSGTPGSTNIPRSTSPITGSQQYTAAGFRARTLRTVRNTTSATPGEPW